MERLSYLVSHFSRSGSDKDYDALYRLSCGQGNGPLEEDGVDLSAGGDLVVDDVDLGCLLGNVDVDLCYHVVNLTKLV